MHFFTTRTSASLYNNTFEFDVIEKKKYRHETFIIITRVQLYKRTQFTIPGDDLKRYKDLLSSVFSLPYNTYFNDRMIFQFLFCCSGFRKHLHRIVIILFLYKKIMGPAERAREIMHSILSCIYYVQYNNFPMLILIFDLY